MDWDHYRIFYETAMSGTITAAAKSLGLSQPSVSRSLSQLETSLDRKLFLRSKHGLILTSDGHILLDYVSKAYGFLHQAEADLTKKQSGQILTIAVSQLTVMTIIPPILQNFKKNNPETHIVLTTSSTRAAVASLQSGLADLSIVPGPLELTPDLKATPCLSLKMVLVAGNEYDFLRGKRFPFSLLSRYPFIGLSAGTAGRKYTDQFLSARGLSVTPAIEVPTSDLIPKLVENNLGLAIVARIFVQNALRRHTVFCLETEEKLPPRSFWVCTSENRPLSLAGERFLKTLTAYIGQLRKRLPVQ